MINSRRVEIGSWDEAIVARNVRSCLSSAHGELMVLIALTVGIRRQFIARVVAVSAMGHLILSVEVSSLRSIGLTWVGPQWLFRDCDGSCHLRFICIHVVRLPVLRSVADCFLTCMLKHFICCSWVVACTSSVTEKFRIVHQIVLNQVVCIFGRHDVVTRLH